MVVGGLSYSLSYCENLSLMFWADHNFLTNAVDKIASVSVVAHNAWDAVRTDKQTINTSLYHVSIILSKLFTVSTLKLSITSWNASQQLRNLSQSYVHVSTGNLSTPTWNTSWQLQNLLQSHFNRSTSSTYLTLLKLSEDNK